ncbi:MAG: tRNA uridine(34) 5-carboxymethylaminomethyl modification radical SAM/GNAT enzyme Elp3 [Candidatus Wildermuthbacteria bacterium]|nr:tRNA uridine(34) 5-carboxymethylaminomethyl modification radical SAM/GNAT enzyme Elp3 [Candidatus Wildermuthbacteria bacterium]
MDKNKLIINDLISGRLKTPDDLASFKRKASKKYGIPCRSNIDLLKIYHGLLRNKSIKKSAILENLLITRPVRSLSGIVNVSVLTKPYPCPGKCLYCPAEKGIPKSYVSGEPAVERAKKLNFNPYLQTKKRIEMLALEGHPTDKIEIRIVGGTWSYYPKKYQELFIGRINDAVDKKAGQRIVGLSVETRPDFIDAAEIKHLRESGVTRVELGVQSIYDDVLKLARRGHNAEATIRATKLLKDAGFKISYQMMLNLPGSTPKKDVEMFREMFSNADFQPDLLKIYPCAILKEAPLYRRYLKGDCLPYSKKTLIRLVKEIKKNVPGWVRIERITRDIPSGRIAAGPTKISNLRQIIKREMQKEGWVCQCIRCREIKEGYNPKEKIFLFRKNYPASGGKEIFLSFENKDKTKLYSLLRLRRTSRGAAIIREIHTYGPLVPISEKRIAPQHRGFGKKLVKTAERIAKKEFNLNKIAVIAATGARDYFRKLGYRLENTYMVKRL